MRVRFVLSCLALAGCAPALGRVDALTMATDAAGDPAVVALVRADAPASVECSGTLVAERVVLSAAHCLVQDDPSGWEVFFGSDVAHATGSYVAVQAAVADPAYDGTTDHDLALVLLSEAASVAPLSVASVAPPTPPGTVRLVGFGVTAAGASDAGRKREGTSAMQMLAPAYLVLAPSPSLPCNGDSGGPVLASSASGEAIVGVVSRGDATCATLARAVRVDAALDGFLAPTLAAWAPGSRALGEPCLYDAHCASDRCIVAADEPLLTYCSAPCGSGADCPSPLVCTEGLCRHPTPSPGALGSACESTDTCLRGECVSTAGICSVRCVAGGAPCAADWQCTHTESIDFFCLPPPRPTCACSTDARRPPLTLAVIAGALLAVRLRRRRAQP